MASRGSGHREVSQLFSRFPRSAAGLFAAMVAGSLLLPATAANAVPPTQLAPGAQATPGASTNRITLVTGDVAELTTSANGQTAAVNALWGLMNTYDMLKNTLGWQSLDGTVRWVGYKIKNSSNLSVALAKAPSTANIQWTGMCLKPATTQPYDWFFAGENRA